MQLQQLARPCSWGAASSSRRKPGQPIAPCLTAVFNSCSVGTVVSVQHAQPTKSMLRYVHTYVHNTSSVLLCDWGARIGPISIVCITLSPATKTLLCSVVHCGSPCGLTTINSLMGMRRETNIRQMPHIWRRRNGRSGQHPLKTTIPLYVPPNPLLFVGYKAGLQSSSRTASRWYAAAGTHRDSRSCRSCHFMTTCYPA